MFAALTLSTDARTTAGVLLVAVVTIEYGGTFMLRLVRGRVPATDLQKSFFRAGHAHAGVLVILALVSQLFLDAPGVPGWSKSLAAGIPIAAILVPAGFFFSAIGREVTQPNRFIALIYLGAAVLAVGVASLGVGLLMA